MLRGLKVSWLLAMTFFGAVASLAPACGGTDSGGDTGAGRCVPGQTVACACPGGTMGTQSCSADGSGFGICGGCDGTSSSSSGSSSGAGGAGGGMVTNMDCGNGKPDPGECGPEGTCAADCGLCGNGKEDPGECPMGMPANCPVDCNPCKGHITFAGFAPDLIMSGPVWTYAGQTGIAAGNADCVKMGADHICTAKELRDAAANVDPVTMKNEFKDVAAGTTAWLHREDTDMQLVGGNMTPGGAGARCNDWKYNTNHISDGEWVEWIAADGIPTYHYDSDPIYDGAMPGVHTQADLPCGGATRNVACCYAACTP